MPRRFDQWDWLRRIMHDPALHPVACSVAFVLADHADVSDGRTYPSYERIGEQLGTSRRSINRAIRQLIDGGYVLSIERPAPGRVAGYVLLTATDCRDAGRSLSPSATATPPDRGEC